MTLYIGNWAFHLTPVSVGRYVLHRSLNWNSDSEIVILIVTVNLSKYNLTVTSFAVHKYLCGLYIWIRSTIRKMKCKMSIAWNNMGLYAYKCILKYVLYLIRVQYDNQFNGWIKKLWANSESLLHRRLISRATRWRCGT